VSGVEGKADLARDRALVLARAMTTTLAFNSRGNKGDQNLVFISKPKR
jgi:hypothetical protein